MKTIRLAASAFVLAIVTACADAPTAVAPDASPLKSGGVTMGGGDESGGGMTMGGGHESEGGMTMGGGDESRGGVTMGGGEEGAPMSTGGVTMGGGHGEVTPDNQTCEGGMTMGGGDSTTPVECPPPTAN